jgi:hypothetical protein
MTGAVNSTVLQCPLLAVSSIDQRNTLSYTIWINQDVAKPVDSADPRKWPLIGEVLE